MVLLVNPAIEQNQKHTKANLGYTFQDSDNDRAYHNKITVAASPVKPYRYPCIQQNQDFCFINLGYSFWWMTTSKVNFFGKILNMNKIIPKIFPTIEQNSIAGMLRYTFKNFCQNAEYFNEIEEEENGNGVEEGVGDVLESLKIKLEHVTTGKFIEINSFQIELPINRKCSVKFQVENPYFFENGDKINFKFPTYNNTKWEYEFYGLVRKGNLKDRTIIALDYATILEQKISFERNRFVGEDFLYTILEIIEELDTYDMIDTSRLHGTHNGKFITYEDKIEANNESAWEVIKMILSKVYDDTNDGYVLPYLIYFEEKGIIHIERQQDIMNETDFPEVLILEHGSNIYNMQQIARDSERCNKVTCVGDGVEVTVEDTNSIRPYSPNYSDFHTYHHVIYFDSKNKDELLQKAIDYIELHKDIKPDYEFQGVDCHFLRRNTIINLKSDEYGIDGRFVIMNKTINSKFETKITVSGKRLTFTDVN